MHPSQMNNSLVQKREQVAQLNKKYATIKEGQSAAQAKLASSEELLQTLITGLATSGNNDNSSGGGYLGQIATAKKRAADAQTEEDGAKMRLTMVEKELREKEAKLKQAEKEGGEGQRSLEKSRKEVQDVRDRIAATGWNAEKEADAERRVSGAREEIKRLNEVSYKRFHISVKTVRIAQACPLLCLGTGSAPARVDIA